MTSQQGSSPTIDNKANLQTIWSAFGKGFSRVVFQEAPRAWQGPDHPKYRSEREKILSHLRPIGMGLFVTGFCFVTFRVSGSRWWKHIRDVYFQTSLAPGGGGNAAAATTRTTATAAAARDESYLTRQALSKQEKVQELMQLPLDLALSVMVGSSAFLLLFDSDKLRDDLIQIPLLPGKSLVHRCVCADVVQAVKHAYEQGTFHSETMDEETKKFFAYFAKNCQTRTRYLERRRESGQNDTVPYPGLIGIIAR